MRGGRPGAGARGGKAGIDLDTSTPDAHYYRVTSRATLEAWTGSQPDMVHPWGVLISSGAFAAGTPLANQLYALPMIVARACAITTLMSRQRSAASTAGTEQLRWGIYGNLGEGLLYPGSLLWDSGAATWAGNTRYTASPGLSLEPGIYWLATVANTAFVASSRTFDQIATTALAPMMGTPSDLLTAGAGGSAAYTVAYRHAFVFAALPDPFPSSAPTGLISGNVPTAYVRLTG
jgi:hypothetical protein